MKKAAIISCLLLMGLGQTSSAVLIHEERFEQPSNGVNFVVFGEHDAGNDYFFRTSNAELGTLIAEDYLNVDGTFFYAGEDTDDAGVGETRVTIRHLNLTPYQNIQVQIAVAAARYPGSSFIPKYQMDDYIILQASAEGGPWTNVSAFRGEHAGNSALREDTDLDGDGDGTILTATFQSFPDNISGSPTSLQTRVLFIMDDTGNEAAFDHIRVMGDAIAPSITVTNPPADANIPTSVSTVEISGSANRGVFGEITWSNDFNGASGTIPAATNWSIAGIPVGLGINAISVSGTNGVDASTSDSINITQIIRPTLDITSPSADIAVPHTQPTANLSGVANTVVVGSLHWTNAPSGTSGTVPASVNWSIVGVPLVPGTNVVTVTGTNIVDESTNDTVNIYQVPAPVVMITSPADNSAVPHTQPTVDLQGTVNGEVHGLLRWTNALTGGTGTVGESDNWSINSIPLAEGTNVITVTGTNIVAQSSNDSVNVYKVPAPVVMISSPAENSAAPHTQTTINLNGTVNGVVHGLLRWTNSLTGGTGTAAEADNWSINSIPLGLGTNVITVTGTNIVGQSDSDSVNIYQVPAPVLNITSPATDITVANGVQSQSVFGTANGVVSGLLTWNNALTGGSGSVPAGAVWNILNIALADGLNTIVVTGTNEVGVATNATVVIGREGVILINEFLADVVGDDEVMPELEYIELINLSGPGSADGLTLLQVKSGTFSAGNVHDRWDLDGLSFGDNGLLSLGVGHDMPPLGGPWSNLVSVHTGFGDPVRFMNRTVFNFDMTFLLVNNCNPAIQPDVDIDTNNDGQPEIPFGGTVLDSVGYGDGQDIYYANAAGLVQDPRLDGATRFQASNVPGDTSAWYHGVVVKSGADTLGRTYSAANASANLPAGAVLTPGRENFPFPNDQDADGLPDDWEQEHFGSPTAGSPDDDDDNDGYSNRDEYWAGSNPTNASSFFMFGSIGPTGTFEEVVFNDVTGVVLRVEGLTLSWESFSNRVYTVYGQTNPASPKYAIDPRVHATPPVNYYVDPTNAAGLKFYSIGVLEPLP